MVTLNFKAVKRYTKDKEQNYNIYSCMQVEAAKASSVFAWYC